MSQLSISKKDGYTYVEYEDNNIKYPRYGIKNGVIIVNNTEFGINFDGLSTLGELETAFHEQTGGNFVFGGEGLEKLIYAFVETSFENGFYELVDSLENELDDQLSDVRMGLDASYKMYEGEKQGVQLVVDAMLEDDISENERRELERILKDFNENALQDQEITFEINEHFISVDFGIEKEVSFTGYGKIYFA